MKMKKYLIIAGARPNFMKIAPLMRAASKLPNALEMKLVHTGQHYDRDMSDVFFDELGIPKPNFHLNVGSGTQTEQMAKIMLSFEQICLTEKPDGVVVVGDVTSTIATALVAKRLGIRVSHVEAGLRSGDMDMPEEVNRVLTDSISDDLFVTEPSGIDNLHKEGRAEKAIKFVGHVMVDTLFYQRDQLQSANRDTWLSPAVTEKLQRYAVCTFHRPSNVDDIASLTGVANALNIISKSIPVVFPVHPRTAANLAKHGISLSENIIQLKPLSYMDFLNLWKDATFVLTDSGGLQEETTALGVQCLTARPSTERPITVDQGTNTIVGTDTDNIVKAALDILAGGGKKGKCPDLWDGKAAERIVAHLV
jgi:UDP-N-acetylglucosamine 2-epimerase (non-hydrolysing)